MAVYAGHNHALSSMLNPTLPRNTFESSLLSTYLDQANPLPLKEVMDWTLYSSLLIFLAYPSEELPIQMPLAELEQLHNGFQ